MDSQQWNWFLTPSTTPTDPVFSPASSTTQHTPNTDSGSHFNDAYNSSLAPQRTPHTILAPSPFPDSQTCSVSAVSASTHADLSARQRHAVQHQPGLFGNSARSHDATRQGDDMVQGFIDSAQVQTPPPTRGSSAKKRSQRTQSVVDATPLLMGAKCPVPDQLAAWNQQSFLPSSFSQPNLNSSGMSQIPAQDPTSVQSNYHGASFSERYMAQLLHQDQFSQSQHPGPSVQGFGQAMPWDLNQLPATASDPELQPQMYMNDPSMHQLLQNDLLRHQADVSFPANLQHQSFGAQLAYTDSQAPSHKPAMNMSVNPSLVYTSPRRFAQSGYRQVHGPMHVEQGQRVSGHQRRQTAESQPHLNASVRPGLKRSNTTGTSRSSSQETLSRSNSTANISRRSSPLKSFARNTANALTSISEATKQLPRSRTSVVLTIDSDGRARTETRPIENSSPAKSLKSRYPSLWEGSESDSDSDSSHRKNGRDGSISSSRTSSSQAKTPKLDTSVEELQGLRLPRSNSSASMRLTPTKAAYTTASQLRRQGSIKKSTHQTSREKRNSMASLTGSLADLPLCLDENHQEDLKHGDAGVALRRAMEQRNAQPNFDSFGSRLIAQSRRQSQLASRPNLPPRTMSLQNLSTSGNMPLNNVPVNAIPPPLPPPLSQHSQPLRQSRHVQHASNGLSPVKVPSHGVMDTSSSFTRCVCNLPLNDGQHMVQCSTCQFWLHSACLGIPAQQVPSRFICTFCCPPSDSFMPYMNWDLTAAV